MIHANRVEYHAQYVQLEADAIQSAVLKDFLVFYGKVLADGEYIEQAEAARLCIAAAIARANQVGVEDTV